MLRDIIKRRKNIGFKMFCFRCDVKSLGARANDQSSSCHGFKAEFDKASDLLQSKWPPVFLAKVACRDGGRQVCDRFKIDKYPGVKIFKHGQEAGAYNGPTDSAGIVRHMLAYSGNQEEHDKKEL